MAALAPEMQPSTPTLNQSKFASRCESSRVSVGPPGIRVLRRFPRAVDYGSSEAPWGIHSPTRGESSLFLVRWYLPRCWLPMLKSLTIKQFQRVSRLGERLASDLLCPLSRTERVLAGPPASPPEKGMVLGGWSLGTLRAGRRRLWTVVRVRARPESDLLPETEPASGFPFRSLSCFRPCATGRSGTGGRERTSRERAGCGGRAAISRRCLRRVAGQSGPPPAPPA